VPDRFDQPAANDNDAFFDGRTAHFHDAGIADRDAGGRSRDRDARASECESNQLMQIEPLL
jgi:hypothetical protein